MATNLKTPKILFCNIAWMQLYNGRKGDKPEGGGSADIKYEIRNFLNVEGWHYGYVQPPSRSQAEAANISGFQRINRRVGAKISSGLSVDGVTVIWVATHPKVGMRRIVGWYKNATVYCVCQNYKKVGFYRIKAKAKDSLLVPEGKRTYIIPSGKDGGMGQANIWYADYQKDIKLVNDVLNYIKRYKGG